jgi:predicted PurR-regulated permease PerM
MTEPRTITISTRTLLLALVLVLAVVLLFVLRDVVITVFVASVLAAAMDPSITALERRGLPRPIGLTILLLLIVGLIAVTLVTFVPLLIDQAQQFAGHLPEIYQRNLDALRRSGNGPIANAVENGVRTLSQSAGSAAQTFFGGALTLLRGMMSLFGVIVLTAYMVMQQKEMKAGLIEFAAARHRPRIARLLREIKSRLGQWLRGQLLLGAVIGTCSYVGLLLLKVKFAVLLAVLAGVTELIPIVGPIIGAIPAVIVAAADQPILGLWVGLMYIGIQQLENHLLVPRIMAQAAGLSPVTVLIALLVGARLAGILGVFIAVPASIIAQVVVEDWMAARRQDVTPTPTASAAP